MQFPIQKVIKYALLVCLFIFLFLPFIQQITNVKQYIDPLNGTFYPEPNVKLTREGWFSGSYQEQKGKFVRDSFGLHHYYIRTISQLKFNLFRKATAAYVVVGHDNTLFETGYFDAYYGRDFIQDTLARQNKLLLVILAPGKASYYPECIPQKYKDAPAVSNYLYFREALKKNALPHIDFNSHFVELKHKHKYPLYPKYGIHWSNYGSVIAFDSINRYVESRLHYDIPDLEIPAVHLSDSLRHTDNDIIKGMNLIWEPKPSPMAYPEYNVRNDTTKHKRPSMLLVGDSFWWHIYSTNIPSATFSDHEFWFYNEAMYPQSFTSPLFVSQTDYFKKIRSFDIIILLHSEATLKRFGNGFVRMAYETYCEKAVYREKMQQIKESIVGTKEWYQDVVNKASERGISVDSMLTLDAIYVLSNPAKD
jgi:hypothetical protein